jgi:membrane protein
MLMVSKAVFFDLDGTLVDSNEFHILAWAEAIELCGLKVSRASLRNEIGTGADMLIPALFPSLGDVQRCLLEHTQGNIFEAHYLGQVRPFPGASALLKRLHASGIKILLGIIRLRKGGTPLYPTAWNRKLPRRYRDQRRCQALKASAGRGR